VPGTRFLGIELGRERTFLPLPDWSALAASHTKPVVVQGLTHLIHIYRKLHVHSRVGAVALALQAKSH